MAKNTAGLNGANLGFEETEDDCESLRIHDWEFEEKMERLTAELSEQFRKSEEWRRRSGKIWQD